MRRPASTLAIVAALVFVSCVSEGQPNRTFSLTVGSPAPSASPTAASAEPTATAATTPVVTRAAPAVTMAVTMKEFPVPPGSGPHDVAPAPGGGVWFTAQRSGQLGWLDPRTGQTRMIPLGAGSAPHGVVVGPDGAPWITDGGLNAIVRVDPTTNEVTRYPLPPSAPRADLNTAAFSGRDRLWFTGQAGYLGRLDVPAPPGTMPQVIPAPRGPGPYGITALPGDVTTVYYASLAGSHIGRLGVCCVGQGDSPVGMAAEPIDPPTKDQGARRVWSDLEGRIWVSEWNAGQVGRYDPKTGQWKEWKLPGARPQPYAVFVDDRGIVWLSDFGTSAIVRFDPATERSDSFPYAPGGNVRQLSGFAGEVWGALSALDRLLLVTTR